MKGRLEYMTGNPSEGVNIWLRDTLLGWQSNMWNEMQTQQSKDAVTDICILFTRYIRRNDKKYSKPVLAENIIGGSIVTPLGEDVARIIMKAEMPHCAIVQYSINANRVGKEEANNRLSMVVYAHFDEPHSKQEAILLVGDEMEERIMKPINNLLANHDAYLGMSNYNDRDILWNRADLEELLIAGSKGCRFVKGLFF